MYSVDEHLIDRALSKATGALVHQVTNAAYSYRNCAHLCKVLREKGDPKLSYWEECLDIAERRLRIFTNTGKLISSDKVRERLKHGKT